MSEQVNKTPQLDRLAAQSERKNLCFEACSGIPSSALQPGMMKKMMEEQDAFEKRLIQLHSNHCTVENCTLDGGIEHKHAFKPSSRSILKDLEGA